MAAEAMIVREPLTIILSQRNWVRAMKGHADAAALAAIKFKEGDALATAFHAESVDRVLVAASGGRFFTLAAHQLPGARGFGEPLSILVDFPAGEDVTAALPLRSDQRLLLAASDGRGFVAEAGELAAETRKGRQVVNLKGEARLLRVWPVGDEDDHVAVLGENRKLLIFALESLPVMVRGQGVALQKYKDGGLADIATLKLSDGLSWPMAGDSGRTRTESDLTPWIGARASAGRLPPQGFPKTGRLR
jgi:topoisomerase-4 subunit A